MAGLPFSTFGTVAHDVHRQRRAANMPLMNKRVVVDSIPMMRAQLVKLCHAFEAAAESGEPLELGQTFLALTTDVAGLYFIHQPLGMQDDLEKARRWKTAVHKIAVLTPLVKQFPWLLGPAMAIPLVVMESIAPDMAALAGLQHDMHTLAKATTGCNKSVRELSLSELEHLPWLMAVVKESLRINALLTSRLPLVPYESLRCKRWTIPARTPVSLTPYDVLHDPTIFADPDTFHPERRLKNSGDGTLRPHSDLERYFVAFGKGPRMCQGMNLAYAKLYLVLATLASRFDFKPSDIVKERDIDYSADGFLGEVRTDSLGVRAVVRRL